MASEITYNTFHLTMKSDETSVTIITYSSDGPKITTFTREAFKKQKLKRNESLTDLVYQRILEGIKYIFMESCNPCSAGGGGGSNYYTIMITPYDFLNPFINERTPSFIKIIEQYLIIPSELFLQDVFNPLNTAHLTTSPEYI